MIKELLRNLDYPLIVTVFVLVITGIIMIHSASTGENIESSDIWMNQIVWAIISFTLMLFVIPLPLKFLYAFSYVFYGVGIVLLVLTEFYGSMGGGSERWLRLGLFRFQPSEFMKLTLILYLAAIFARGERSPAFQSQTLMVHYMIVLTIIGLVFLEPDLGSSLILFFVAMTLFYLAGISWKQLAKMGLVLVPLISLGLLLFPYQRQRLTDYLGTMSGAGPMSHQVKQSIIGLANGGLTGMGYASGKQKLFFLPEPFSDFILASLGEELGFIGIVIVFTLMLFILWRGIRIARHAPDRYGMLLAGGITAMILINALMHTIHRCRITNGLTSRK